MYEYTANTLLMRSTHDSSGNLLVWSLSSVTTLVLLHNSFLNLRRRTEDIAPENNSAMGPGVEVLGSRWKEALFICHMALSES
jgi:hypothetical protein